MARLAISLLGPFTVALDGQPVTTFESVKVRALLAFLAVEASRPHDRAWLADLLWPELPGETARTYLRHVLGNLREAIADKTAVPPFLRITRDTVQFNAASDHDLDVACFRALLAACAAHPHRRREACPSCARRCEEAVALYRGDFLDQLVVRDSGPFEEWAALQRERLRQDVVGTLSHLVTYYRQRGFHEAAQRHATRWVERDPWDEQARRQLMTVLWHNGQRSAALAQYTQCCHILQQELGIEPEAATTALYARIRDAGDVLPQEVGMRWQSNLPVSMTPFIGRNAELTQLADLLQDPACHLLTLTGPGGIGKTRLALQVAVEAGPAFAHGAIFVSLSALSQPDLLAPTIAAALNLTLPGGVDVRMRLLTWLADRELLLILDNFEQLLEPGSSAPEFLTAVVAYAPAVCVLVTSRERLHLTSEWVVGIEGLRYPTDAAVVDQTDYEAVCLFAQHAVRARNDFVLQADNLPWVVRICQLVAGMPLAIELAAAWVRLLGCREIAQQIECGLDVLTTVRRDISPRHRSMRAVLDHSWTLLAPDEQQLLQHLAIFRGGFTWDAARDVASASLADLASLVDKSLVRVGRGERYELHDLVRQYGQERLGTAESEAVARRHVNYFLQLAEHVAPLLETGDQLAALDRLEPEHDNFRAALAWSLARAAHADLSMRLACALGFFWQLRSHSREGLGWLERALAQARRVPGVAETLRAKTLFESGWLAYNERAFALAHDRFAESLEVASAQGERYGRAYALLGLGYTWRAQGEYLHATRLLEQSLALFREEEAVFGINVALHGLGELAMIQANWAGATALLRESLGLARGACNLHQAAWALDRLGSIAAAQGDAGGAVAMQTESLALFRVLRYAPGMVEVLCNLGRNAYEQGNHERAIDLYGQVLALGREHGDRWWIISALLPLARMAGQRGQSERAARLLGAATALREGSASAIQAQTHAAFEREAAAIIMQLNESQQEAVLAEGRMMSLEQAIAYALEGVEQHTDGTQSTP